MICVNDDALARRALLLRSWGRTSSLFVESETIENRFNVELDGFAYDAKFLFEELGFNVEPSEIGAAFGLVQLDKLERNISARERNFAAQNAFFKNYEEWFVLPRQLAGSRTGWLAFPLTVRSDAPVHASRDADIPGDAGHPDPPRLHRQHPAATRDGRTGIQGHGRRLSGRGRRHARRDIASLPPRAEG